MAIDIKKILVPTDFSECADIALSFSIELAKVTGASIELLTCYQIPVVTTDVTYTYDAELVKKFEEDARKRFEQIDGKMKKIRDVDYSYKIDLAYPQEGVLNTIRDNDYDVVIMGTQGASNIAGEFLGSISTAVIAKSPIPVIVVPGQWELKRIDRMALASDYRGMQDIANLDIVVSLCAVLEAELYVVNVKRSADDTTFDEAYEAKRLDRYLEGITHSFHVATGDSVEKVLEQFIQDNDIGMVALMPRKHNLFEKLFHKSTTKQVALHTEVPLLAFHS